MTIYTIGYEGLDIDRFLFLLKAYDIEAVIDVRELPLSRKPGFSKKTLSNILNLNGLEYEHIAELGCPKSIRDSYHKDGNWIRYSEMFSKYLETQQTVLDDLSTTIFASTCALLCFEAEASECHRSLIARSLQTQYKTNVVHIKKDLFKTKSLVLCQQSVA